MENVVRLLEKRLLQASEPADRMAVLLELAESHADEFRSREGLRAAREALAIARAREDPIAIGRALAAATTCHYQRGDYVSAVATGLDAADAYAEGDRGGRARALCSIALALHAVEASDLAEDAAQRAVADALAARDPSREALARDVLGLVLLGRGRHGCARHEFRLAATHHRGAGHAARLKKSVAGLGHTYRREGVSLECGREGSRFLWRQALRVYEIARSAGDSAADDAIIEQAMAECHCRLGDLPAAWTHVARALALARGVGNPSILAGGHFWEAHVLREMGELQAAERACEQACAAAETLVLDPTLADCLRALATVHDAQGRFERASDVEARSRNLRLEREASLALIRTQLAPLWHREKLVSDTSFRQVKTGV